MRCPRGRLGEVEYPPRTARCLVPEGLVHASRSPVCPPDTQPAGITSLDGWPSASAAAAAAAGDGFDSGTPVRCASAMTYPPLPPFPLQRSTQGHTRREHPPGVPAPHLHRTSPYITVHHHTSSMSNRYHQRAGYPDVTNALLLTHGGGLAAEEKRWPPPPLPPPAAW